MFAPPSVAETVELVSRGTKARGRERRGLRLAVLSLLPPLLNKLNFPRRMTLESSSSP